MVKYELTENFKVVSGKKLYQIQALTNFGNVKKGELGGYIESEKNLSQEGRAWVYDNALVFDNAWVYGYARVFNKAQVYGYAKVYGGALVFDRAWVFGKAWVYDNAMVYGKAWVFGKAQVYGNAHVCGKARIVGKVKLSTGLYTGAQVLQ